MGRLTRLWCNVFQRERFERELNNELLATLTLLVEEKVRAGIPREDAVRQARVEFGAIESIKDECRQARGVLWLDERAHDVRYALRGLARASGFTAAALLTLALGIGATAAMFSVVYGVLLKPLPFDEPDRLVSLSHRSANGAGRNQGPATYFTYRDNQRVFEDIGAWDRGEATITGRGEPEQINVLQVTEAVLPLLRVQPLMGRAFASEDGAPGGPMRVMLTYGYWQRRFGGAANIVNQPLVVDGRAAEVIGVLPSSFRFPGSDNALLLLPLPLDRADAARISFGFQALARLKPGVTIAQANADVARMISLLPTGFLRTLLPDVRSQAAYVSGNAGDILWILFAAVGVVLLIACGNVANLVLIRAEGRQQDFAVRAALGASRARLAGALLSESILLALAGGALGVLLAAVTVRLLRQLAPAELPRLDEIGIDPTVLFFTLLISVLNGTVFGAIAVRRFTTRGATVMNQGGRSASDAPERNRSRRVLVVAQIAMALTLMTVSGLLIRTVIAMRRVNPGFSHADTVQTFRVSIPTTMVSDSQQTARTFESIARRLEQVAGVASVGLASSITMDGEDNGNTVDVEDSPLPDGTPAPLFRFKSVAPGYFEAMGIPIVAGRSIDWTDIYEARPAVVIAENLARKYWREPAKAVGRRVRSASGGPWREIVGVVGGERDDGLDRPETAIVYWPLLNGYQRRTMAYAVRSDRVGSAAFQRELERAVWSVNPSLPLAAVQTLAEIRERSMARTSFATLMLSLAAAIALFLAIVGIFGVIAYTVTLRSREVGIRMALGAPVWQVCVMFLRQGLGLTGAGIVIGVGCALLLSRVLSTLLFGVGPNDPATYVAVSGILAVAGLLATYLPVRRASRIDPIIALRADV